MALKLEDKKAIVSELSEVVARSTSALAADYRGLTVTQMTELRSKARQAGVYTRIVKNTLARRVLKDTEYACLIEALTGPIILMLSQDEPGAAARCVRDFLKQKNEIQVRGIALNGTLFPGSQLKAMAELPSRHEAIATLAVVIQAPVAKFVRTLSETYAQLVRVMGQVRDQKQAAG